MLSISAIVFHKVKKKTTLDLKKTEWYKKYTRVKGSEFHTQFQYPYHMSIKLITFSLWVSVF